MLTPIVARPPPPSPPLQPQYVILQIRRDLHIDTIFFRVNAPQVKIVNGRIVIDQNSLVVEANEADESQFDTFASNTADSSGRITSASCIVIKKRSCSFYFDRVHICPGLHRRNGPPAKLKSFTM